MGLSYSTNMIFSCLNLSPQIQAISNINKIPQFNKISKKLSEIEINSPLTQKLNIKDFEFINVLGEGSYGKVYLVRKLDNLNYYAMKILRKNNIKNESQKIRILIERYVMKENDHPFIVKLKYSFQNERKIFFVMEYVEGGELFKRLRTNFKFCEKVAKFYICEIIIALQYLHEKLNIIYRDLKPENILMDKEGHIRLSDFGLSKFLEKDNLKYTFCGTQEYMAPEILNQDRYTQKIDIWSLGCIYYELINGIPLFQKKEENNLHLYENILHKDPIYPISMSKEVINLIKKMLLKDPNQRIGLQEIKNDKYFQDVDWNDVLNKNLIPPISLNIDYFTENDNETEIIDFNNSKYDDFQHIEEIFFNDYVYKSKSEEYDGITIKN